MACFWTAEFCLGCDTQTDGAAYCSEACRLLEYEKTSTSTSTTPSSSAPSSPTLLSAPSYPWSLSSPATAAPIHALSFASNGLDFRHRAISTDHDSSHQQQSSPSTPSPDHQYHLSLTPSSSHSSLCSMQTTASTMSMRAPAAGPDSVIISDRASKVLREYAMSLEYVKLQRRRSY